MSDNVQRCPWAASPPIYITYHDCEWGVPLYDDRRIFEHLILEGFQAGLSWLTILNKRQRFREVFSDFDAQRIARFGEAEVAVLMADKGIVRNRAKILAAITNAQAFCDIQAAFGSFSQYIWGFVDGQPIVNRWRSMSEVPAKTDRAAVLSKDLKKRGFRFVGPTTVYAHMQATGMVNDHLVHCFRHGQVH